jgi:hypothetical protein
VDIHPISDDTCAHLLGVRAQREAGEQHLRQPQNVAQLLRSRGSSLVAARGREGVGMGGWRTPCFLCRRALARMLFPPAMNYCLLVERLDVHRDGSLSTTRLSKIKKRERRVSKTKSYLHALLLGRVGNVTIFPLQITSPPRSQPAVVLRDAGACLLMSRAIV